MRKLILFDIDGTLITNGDLHRRSFLYAIKETFNIDVASKSVTMGMTDPLIFAMFLREAGIDQQTIDLKMPELFMLAEKYFKDNFTDKDVVILPGVRNLLPALAEAGATLMLLTGNLEDIAKTKLESLGIYHYFQGGAFGSNPHKTRGELVAVAAKKSGFENELDNIYLVGDTPLDIKAAHEGGLKHSIGVATGIYSKDDLVNAGPETVLTSLEDKAAALKAFGY